MSPALSTTTITTTTNTTTNTTTTTTFRPWRANLSRTGLAHERVSVGTDYLL